MSTRRGFLQGAAALAGTMLVHNPTVHGAVLNDNGVFVPTQPEVLIATKMPSETSFGSFSMYITKMTIEQHTSDITMPGDVNRNYLPTGADINIRGTQVGPMQLNNFYNEETFRRKILVTLTVIE